MKDKEAIDVLIKLIERYPLTDEEEEAISNAIGILSWTMLAESGLEARKAKRDREE